MKTYIQYVRVTDEEIQLIETFLLDIVTTYVVKDAEVCKLTKDLGYMCEEGFVRIGSWCDIRSMKDVVSALHATNQLYKEVVKGVHWTKDLKDNPKWCKVRDPHSGDNPVVEKIIGYDNSREFRYEGDNSGWWEQAEPLSDELQTLLNKEVSDE